MSVKDFVSLFTFFTLFVRKRLEERDQDHGLQLPAGSADELLPDGLVVGGGLLDGLAVELPIPDATGNREFVMFRFFCPFNVVVIAVTEFLVAMAKLYFVMKVEKTFWYLVVIVAEHMGEHGSVEDFVFDVVYSFAFLPPSLSPLKNLKDVMKTAQKLMRKARRTLWT